jgi:hypothetical protein
MFARAVIYLHAAHLPVPKSLAAKPSISVTSKLIEIKRLQLHYFGHLRKTGGRGSYQLPTRHPLFPPHSPHSFTLSPAEGPAHRSISGGGPLLLSPVFPLHTSTSLVCLLFPLLTQKQRGVGGMSSQSSFLRSRLFRPPAQKCRRADIFDFSPYFSHFFTSTLLCRLHPASRQRKKSWPRRSVRGAKGAHESQRYIEEGGDLRGHWSLDTGRWRTSCPLSVTSLQYPGPIAHPLARTEPRGIPAGSGSPRCGYVPFAYRCPDAHD